MTAQSNEKTILVCHGAWSGGWSWKKMFPLVEAAGYRMMVPTYTGLGEREHLANPAIDLETHIQDILSAIKFEDLNDIILLGHSYGGMVATGVADRVRNRVRATHLSRRLRAPRRAVAVRSQRGRAAGIEASAKNGDGWRRRRFRPRRTRLPKTSTGSPAPRADAAQMFPDETEAAAWRAGDAAQLHLRQAHHAGHTLASSPGARRANPASAMWRSMPVTRRTSARPTS